MNFTLPGICILELHQTFRFSYQHNQHDDYGDGNTRELDFSMLLASLSRIPLKQGLLYLVSKNDGSKNVKTNNCPRWCKVCRWK